MVFLTPAPGPRPVCSRRPRCFFLPRAGAAILWKAIRISFLLLVLVLVAGVTLRDRIETRSWKHTLWVGVFPLNGDGSPQAESYISSLSPEDFTSIETFIQGQAHRYGVSLEEPVHIEL